MKTWSKVLLICLLVLLIGGWGLSRLWGAPASRSAEAAAIQAIQQAPDPSAVVGAFANGFAVNRNDPNLYAAYVSSMVDLGLPEMAYHQAQTLTTLDPKNGVGWGVIAYVDARRADMPEAISAINLAGHLAPDNKFVQSTAGEILAWYDLKADKTRLPESAKTGLAKIRSLLEKKTAFAQAYDTARQAYQAQAGVAPQPAPTAPASGGFATAPPPTPYYNDYYYDWGPGWVEPAPWWWWEPAGYWSGFDFLPEFPVVVFNNHEFFEHHHFHHGEFFEHEHRFEHQEFAEHHGAFFGHEQNNNPALFHRGPQAHTGFFGIPDYPAPTVARSSRQNFVHAPAAIPHHGRTVVENRMPATVHPPTVAPEAEPQKGFAATGRIGVTPSTPAIRPGLRKTAPALVSPHEFAGTGHPLASPPAFHSAPRTLGTAPPITSPPRFASGFAGRFHSAPAFGGGFHGVAPMHPAPSGIHGGFARAGVPGGFHGAFHGPAMGGGFHGGFAGGGFHGGGGHR